MHSTPPPTPKVKVTTLTQWLKAVTLRISHPGQISYKGHLAQLCTFNQNVICLISFNSIFDSLKSLQLCQFGI